MSLKNLLAVNLPITPRHDRWLGLHADDPVPHEIALWVASQLQGAQRDRSVTFSASSTGRCERQQVLRFIAHPQVLGYDPQMAHRFQVGDWGHLRWQTQGLCAGWLAAAEVPVALAEYRMTGTMDGVVDTGEGFEFKTINNPGFNAVMKAAAPKAEHVLQVHAYMMASGIRRFCIIYESTFSGEWKEFVVDYDHAVAEQVCITLDKMAGAVDEHQLPPVREDCLEKIGAVYNQCKYRKDCLAWAAVNQPWPSTRMLRIRTAV
jgi:hypothetical protein